MDETSYRTGEVRDMLFDDKGCIFIAMFGAHPEEEKEVSWGGLSLSLCVELFHSSIILN